MKRWFIAALLALVVAAALVVAIEYDPGYVLVAWGEWILETSLWVGLLLLLAVLLLIGLVLRLLRAGWWQGWRIGNWFAGRRRRRARRQTTRGLIALVEGNVARARQLLERSAPDADTPLVNYLLAARAAAEQGDREGARGLLVTAGHSTPEAGIAIALTQAELELQAGRPEACLAMLQPARRHVGRHPFVLKLLMRAYSALADWSGLIALLPDLRRHGVAGESELATLERQAWSGRLREAVPAHAPGEGGESALTARWQELPRALQRDSGMVRVYAGLLHQLDAQDIAERVLRRQLDREWQGDLVELYGRVGGANPRRQLLAAERWLAEHPGDAGLLLCLGRLSLRNELWGKAREYFEHSLRLEESPETCAELARLLSGLGDQALSSQYCRRGLLASTAPLPELPLPARHTVAG